MPMGRERMERTADRDTTIPMAQPGLIYFRVLTAYQTS